jgi:hypothetical protein
MSVNIFQDSVVVIKNDRNFFFNGFKNKYTVHANAIGNDSHVFQYL